MRTYLLLYSLYFHTSYFVRSSVPKLDPIKPDSLFEYLTTTKRFIDKTLLIKDFIETDDDRNYNLITVPADFGKTVVTDMLKRFFEISPEALGDPYDKKETLNYLLFTDPNITLNIAKDKDFIERHLGEYPLIYMDFGLTFGADRYSNLVRNIGYLIRYSSITPYFWLYTTLLKRRKYGKINQTLATQSEMDAFYSMGKKKIFDEDDIVRCLSVVSSLMHEFYGKKIIVVIDNYDSPILDAIQEDMDVVRVYNLLYAIYHKLFEENSHVGHAFITGKLEIALPACIKHRRFLYNHKFAPYYGLSWDEVMKQFDIVEPDFYPVYDEELQDVEIFYKNYHIRHTLTPLFNMYNILNFAESRLWQYHWERGAALRTICGFPSFIRLPEIRKQMRKLIAENQLTFQLLDNTTSQYLHDYREIQHRRTKQTRPHHLRYFLTCMYENGFFTHTSVENTYKMVNRGIANELGLWLNHTR